MSRKHGCASLGEAWLLLPPCSLRPLTTACVGFLAIVHGDRLPVPAFVYLPNRRVSLYHTWRYAGKLRHPHHSVASQHHAPALAGALL